MPASLTRSVDWVGEMAFKSRTPVGSSSSSNGEAFLLLGGFQRGNGGLQTPGSVDSSSSNEAFCSLSGFRGFHTPAGDAQAFFL